MTSEIEDVREAFLTPECNRHACLGQTLLACNLKIFCLLFNLCSTGCQNCPLLSASEDNSGAGCGWGDSSGSTSSLPGLIACFCQHILQLLYSPCMHETDPNHPKGTAFMARVNDQASCTHAIFYVQLHTVSLALRGRPIMAEHNSQLLFTKPAECLNREKWLGMPALSHAAEGKATSQDFLHFQKITVCSGQIALLGK